jgi:hypothetical protein
MQNVILLHEQVQGLYPPQKFERPPFLNGCSYGIENYGFEVTLDGMTSLLNLKNLPNVSKVDGGTDKQTKRMMISLSYILPLERKVG